MKKVISTVLLLVTIVFFIGLFSPGLYLDRKRFEKIYDIPVPLMGFSEEERVIVRPVIKKRREDLSNRLGELQEELRYFTGLPPTTSPEEAKLRLIALIRIHREFEPVSKEYMEAVRTANWLVGD